MKDHLSSEKAVPPQIFSPFVNLQLFLLSLGDFKVESWVVVWFVLRVPETRDLHLFAMCIFETTQAYGPCTMSTQISKTF